MFFLYHKYYLDSDWQLKKPLLDLYYSVIGNVIFCKEFL